MTSEQVELKTKPSYAERTDELLVETKVPLPEHFLSMPDETVVDLAYTFLKRRSERLEEHQRTHSDWCSDITDKALDDRVSFEDRQRAMVYVHKQGVITLLRWNIDQTEKEIDCTLTERGNGGAELLDTLVNLNSYLNGCESDLKEFLIRNGQHRNVFKTIEDYCGDLSNTEAIKRK